tara:strand:- start:5480 stop:5662 length:183 start_codon:yes stop_codon:yes gene_type:complete
MLIVLQAIDRAQRAEIKTDVVAALERKLHIADRVSADRDGWLNPHERIVFLRKLGRGMSS